jgi:hypothetical protein
LVTARDFYLHSVHKDLRAQLAYYSMETLASLNKVKEGEA